MVSLKKLHKAGVHLGHSTRKWNPNMEPYIYGQTNRKRHLINLVKTKFYLDKVVSFLTEHTKKGRRVLFIATKETISGLVTNAAKRTNSPYITEKWLGGMLTNWETIQCCTKKLRRLDYYHRRDLFKDFPKKELASVLRQKSKLQRDLGGVKMIPPSFLEIIPGPNPFRPEIGEIRRLHPRYPLIAIIIGQTEEISAVNECSAVGIRTITLLDTNNDPSKADLFVPANDDALASVEIILDQFVDAIQKGKNQFLEKKRKEEEEEERLQREWAEKMAKRRAKNRFFKTSKRRRNQPTQFR